MVSNGEFLEIISGGVLFVVGSVNLIYRTICEEMVGQDERVVSSTREIVSRLSLFPNKTILSGFLFGLPFPSLKYTRYLFITAYVKDQPVLDSFFY